MLTTYIQLALRQAHYEMLDERSFYGEIPGFQGVYATANTLEECRDNFRKC